MLNLVINETAETPDPEDEYFTLEFRHNAYNDEQRTPGWGIVSFRLDKIAKQLTGLKTERVHSYSEYTLFYFKKALFKRP